MDKNRKIHNLPDHSLKLEFTGRIFGRQINFLPGSFLLEDLEI